MAVRTIAGLMAGVMAWGLAALAQAAEPVSGALNLQPAATPIMHRIRDFHDLLLVIIISIVALVLVLLLFVMIRFNRRVNPTPSKTTHNTLLEVIWTGVPVLILVVIALYSFPLLTYEDTVPDDVEMTIKATGNQWNWTYEYPDAGGFSFTAVMIPDNELKPGQRRLLETDNRVVVPVDTTVKLLVTASDVIHAWAVPAFGIKIDAVPGRINEVWFKVEEEGVYYGQCSELCGRDHGFMPIVVEVVSKERFAAWLEEARQLYADAAPRRPMQLALAR
ncbi:MAG: cytochrome c oxidase subunit II [Pseudomonadota bacterium]